MSLTPNDFQVVTEQILHKGIRFDLSRVVERGPDQREHVREIVRHPGAAVVLAVLDDSQVVMVRQHRTAVGKILLELPAGVLDPGEDPVDAARRELEEETGYRAASMQPLTSFYPTPGMTDEVMHLFIATGLEAGEPRPDDGEHVEIDLISVDILRDLILQGEITDGKTMLGLMFVMFVGMTVDRTSVDRDNGEEPHS